MQKEASHIYEIDLIRTICATGIIVYHFFCDSVSSIKIGYTFANGNWGRVFVVVFLMVSGGMLYYRNQNIPSLKKYYYKRWKSIFPAFYIGFAYYFLENVFQQGHIFYMGPPRLLILSFLGMDGYFSYQGENYYLIGEWFLGAIIMIYLLYPLLLRIFKKNPCWTLLLMTGLLICALSTDYFHITGLQNFIPSLLCFTLGMFVMEYHPIFTKNKVILTAGAVLMTLLIQIPVPINPELAMTVCGLCLYILLYWCGTIITKNKQETIKSFLKQTGKLSYCVFLLQHQVIYKVLRFANPVVPSKAFLLLFFTILLVWLYAGALSAVTQSAINSKLYQKLETFICS